MSSIKSSDINIKQLEPIEHVLQNPDMYFGDIKVSQVNGFCYDIDNNEVKRDKLIVSNVLIKMVDEILMNATDNAIKSYKSTTPMTYVKIKINKDNKVISIENDGLSIPIRKNKQSDKYLPEIAFTNLFSSSNFNNNRTGAGKNGVGASITNVLSSTFVIDIVCDNIRYKQVIKNNCKTINEPSIKEVDKNNYVNISFRPDMNKIMKIAKSNENINDVFNNTLLFINKRILDVNMLLSYYDITTYYNDNEMPNITFEDYANMFIKDTKPFMKFTKDKLYEILIKDASTKATPKINISFINNIAVSNGSHIKNVLEQIETSVAKKLKIKKDEVDKSLKIIKSRLIIFMKCNLVNPMFEGQSKNILQSADNLDKIKLSKQDLDKILEEIDFDEIINGKKIDDINKDIKVKKSRKLIIDKLTDAEFAGSKHSNKCTLFLCEGDSAAKLAKDGISYLGHNYFGVYPLGGKPVNVRDETLSKIQNNKTVMYIAKILGLPLRTNKQIQQHKLDISKLRYGKIVMLKDADTDGAHIMGLVINLLEQLYPELLDIKGFFNEFITPMIKLIIPNNIFNKLDVFETGNMNELAGTIIETKNNVIYPFYNTNDYNKFIEKYPICNKLQPMYIKGLGGHNQKDTIEYFKNYLNNVVGVFMDEESHDMLNTAFNKKLSDSRKKLLCERTGETALPRYIGKPINCSDFIKNDWLDYSYDACLRAIPSCVDGLKPSQRKILYVLLNNYKPAKSNTEENAKNFKKVFQMCGEVAQKGYYHHGDQSLNGTIIAMARDFTGSNNLPLLAYSGSFGSRDMNGDDAGAPRYISSTIHEVSRYIFPQSDDSLLVPNIEDNNKVEPIYYVPIIPMILVNGAIGIGTGYSTTILQHNPLSIIRIVKKYINTYISLIDKQHIDINEVTKSYESTNDTSITNDTAINDNITNESTNDENTNANITNDDITILDTTKLSKEDKQILYNILMFKPHYNYYKGCIELDEDKNNYTVYGVWEIKGFVVNVTEVPFVTSKQKFIKNLQKLYLSNIITDYQENKSKSINDFNFTITFNENNSDVVCSDENTVDEDYIIKKLGLEARLSLSNIVAFSNKNKLTRFVNESTMFKEWFNTRETLYIKRKNKIVNEYKNNIKFISEKARFIKSVIDKKLVLNLRTKKDIENDLDKMKFTRIDNNYNYLLNLPISSLTKEKYEELINKLDNLKKEFDNYNKLTIFDIWMNELNELDNYIRNNYDIKNW